LNKECKKRQRGKGGGLMDLENMPILNGLVKYMNLNIIPFHMPGHKSNINGFEELKLIKEKLYDIDKTEVNGLDNLHIPEEMILEAEKLTAIAYGANSSFFLVNGSTCGIYSMIMGMTKPGDKILIQRNCHRSVFMACMMGDLNVVYVDAEILEEFNFSGGISIDNLIEVMEGNKDAKAFVLTYPSYYGICSDLVGIVKEAHKRNMYVLVDEAHGAHFPFNSKLPETSMKCGADAAVTSFHKTLPAMTQTAVLNVKKGIDDSSIRFMLRIFQSTSPSYILMASIDAARSIMVNRGEGLIEKLIAYIDKFQEAVINIGSYKMLSREYIGSNSIYDLDKTKIVLTSSFIGGRELERALRRDYDIQAELSDEKNILFITTVGDNQKAFEMLFEALYNISKKLVKRDLNKVVFKTIKYVTCLNMREAYYSKKKTVKLKEAVGCISGEMVVPYPPGIPILLPGELITGEIIEYIELIKLNGLQLNGINDLRGDNILIIDI
jgi:arginine/lysine/ornithine decarboxylase